METPKIKIAIAASAGGHLTELDMILTKSVIKNSRIIYLTEKNKRTQNLKNTYFFKPFSNNPFPYFPAFLNSIKILKKEKPDLVITNGAEIALPVLLASKFLGIKSIYLDIAAAATIPTLAGKVSYYLSDIFLVQYPEMGPKYGKKAFYRGGVI